MSAELKAVEEFFKCTRLFRNAADPWLKIQPYCHQTYGVVSNNIHVSTDREIDNYHLYTAQWFNVLFQAGIEVPKEMRDDYDDYYRLCAVEPGLLRRYPNYFDLNSHDELYGAASISWVYAFEIYEYGKRHGFCWNNMNSGSWEKRAYFGRLRFPDFIAYLKVASGGKLGIIGQTIWGLWTFHTTLASREETSGKLLKYLQMSTMARAGCVARFFIRRWQREMRIMYPGGVQEIFGIYFGNHPITRFARTDFNIRGLE